MESHKGVSKNRGFSSQIIHFNRVFHEINHPFSGTPIFGNSHSKCGLISFPEFAVINP